MANDTLITRLATWIGKFDYDGVPDRVVELAKFSLLDALGGAFAATTFSEGASEALATVDDIDDSTACSVIGRKRKASVVNATFANGLLIRALDFNDYLPSDPNDGTKLGSHPSDNMAIGMAVGEMKGSSGRDFLTAMVMGYEVNGRLQKLLHHDSYWDHTTATGLVSPAIAGRLMRLDHDQLSAALGFGMAHGATPGSVRRGHISSGKFLADPIVAMTGVFGTMLAVRGVTGPISVFEGSKGLRKAIFHDADLEELVRPLDRLTMFEGVCIKAYPCFANSQSSVSAAIEARKSFKGGPKNIERIEMTMDDVPAVTQQLDDVTRRYPKNQETADHSYHFVVAVALIDGEVTLRSYENERWNDPQVVDLMNRIQIVPDKAWGKRDHGGSPASLTIVGKDGSRASAEVAYPSGHIKNPLGADGIAEKFKGNVRGLIDDRRSAAIVDTVYSLEKQPSLNRLMGLLAG